MLKLVGIRLVAMVPSLLGIIFVALLLVELMPGDAAQIMAGDDSTPEMVAAIHEDLGLDKPLWERYVRYVGDVARGDLGESPLSGVNVRDRVMAAVPVTLSLASVSLFLAVSLGLMAGTLQATRPGSVTDRALTVVTSLMQAVPSFVVGLGLVIALAVNRSWFPAAGYAALTEDPMEWLRHLVLPAVALALRPAAELARQTRGALIDTFDQDYIRATRSKGLSESRILLKHAAKNAATPVVTVIGVQVGRLIGGAIVVEIIFGLPGLGQVAVNSVFTRDVPALQGVVLISALGVLLANLVVDVLYGYLNPKLRD